MRRREFIGLVGGVAVTLPLVARAQSSLPVVGFLNSASSDSYKIRTGGVSAGLEGNWICRKPECDDRVPLGRGAL